LKNLRGRWTLNGPEGDSEDTLKDITFEVTKGQLCAVIGPVGSGKVNISFLFLAQCHFFVC